MPNKTRVIAVVGLLLIFYTGFARAESFGQHFEYTMVTGVYPFLALPFCAVVYLVRRKVPWRSIAWSMLALILLSMTTPLVISMAGNIFPWYLAPLSWLCPLLAWMVCNRWIFHLKTQDAE